MLINIYVQLHPMGMYKKGQASLDQLIIVAIGITLITIIFYFSINLSSDSMRISQAKDMVEKLSKSADHVYSLGRGSRDVISVYVPDGLVSTNISNNMVHMRVSTSSGESDIFSETKPALIGELPTTPGKHEILVTHTESGKILFGENVLYCSPAALTRTFMQGENGTASIFIQNVGEYELENILALLEGNLDDLMSMTQPDGHLYEEESSSVGLGFSVPVEQTPGSYSGTVTISADEMKNGSYAMTECATTITLFVTSSEPPDNEGPIVISIGNRPRNPSVFSTIRVQATGDDATTGGSPIYECQMELDNSGIWNFMVPIDGAYGEVREGAQYTMEPLSEGYHEVSVRCIDDYFNVGPERKDNFTVKFYIKEILFVTVNGMPSPEEQLWIDWVATHNSYEGFAWNYDVISSADLTNWTVDPGDYQVVAMADYPNTDTALDAALMDYRATGHYVLLLGNAMKYGVTNLGVGTGNAASHSKNALKVQTTHYITEGYEVAQIYNITNESYGIYYHPSFEAINVLSMEDQDGRIVVGESSYVLTNGATRPDMFTTDGEIFALRVFDYALLNS